MYEDKWIEEFDYDFLDGESLYNIFREYCHNSIGTFDLNPNFSDYGDVNRTDMNADIKSTLEDFIKRKSP